MTKKQLEKYIYDAMTLKFDAIYHHLKDDWPFEFKEHFGLFPKKLYKYVTLNENYTDSIINNYLYLCPAKELDDQFECRVDFPIGKVLDNKSVVDDTFVEALIDKVSEYTSNFDREKMAETIIACLDKEKRPDLGKISLEFDKFDINITDEQKDNLLKAFSALMTGAWISDNSERLFKFLIEKAYAAQEQIGIGSLTENNKSQVMWEMYGNHYRGVCIEYDFTDDLNAMINTLPVIYADKRKSSLLLILVNICIDSFMLALSKGKIGSMNSAKDYVKLFLTKYNEWSFQKEWRLIGEAGFKYPAPKIKKIYLGKRISESDKNKIMKISIEKNIELYMQLDNYDSLELKYEKIELK